MSVLSSFAVPILEVGLVIGLVSVIILSLINSMVITSALFFVIATAAKVFAIAVGLTLAALVFNLYCSFFSKGIKIEIEEVTTDAAE